MSFINYTKQFDKNLSEKEFYKETKQAMKIHLSQIAK